MNAPSKPILLVVDDEPLVLRSVKSIASKAGFEVFAVPTAERGLEILEEQDVDIALVDNGLPRMLGIELIAKASQKHPNTDYVLFTGQGEPDLGFKALQRGASDYVTKPIRYDWLMSTIRRGLQAKRLRDENQGLRGETSPVDRMLLGPSSRMDKLRQQIRDYARSRAPIMILGESGVGKDVCARALNAESGRRGTYVAKNCGAIPGELAELELFGAEPNSHSNAGNEVFRGAFETADSGVVFLDEVGDLPLRMQVKLLRVLENGTFQRIGGSHDVEFNGRIVGATNKPLPEMVKDGAFRQDLLHRFPLVLHVPPLREHLEDVPMLAWRFLSDVCAQLDRHMEAIDPEAMEMLQAHEWRDNNVRELRNVILNAVVTARGRQVRVDDLPARIRDAVERGGAPARRTGTSSSPTAEASPPATGLDPELLHLAWTESKQSAEAAFADWYLRHHLNATGWNISAAARRCGVKRSNFHRLMKRYEIDRPEDQDLTGG